MRDKIELTFAQKEIMSEFYSVPARKVLLGKSQRNKLWNAVKSGSVAESFLNGIKCSCPALHHQIVRHNQEGNNIQSAVFSECVYAQALADIFKLPKFRNYSDCEHTDFLPQDIVDLTPRYAYISDDDSRWLIQAGGHGGVDCALITVHNGKKKEFKIEFKERVSKAFESDLPKYDEDGVLKVTTKFLAQYPQTKDMLSEKSGLNFFENIGHNIHGFSPKCIRKAIDESNNGDKCARVVCTEDCHGNLVMLPINQISLWARTEGEIRPAGRNSHAVWTPQALNKFLVGKGATINGDDVVIPFSQLKSKQPRGGRGVSRYIINSLFFVRAGNVVVDGATARFKIGDVLQLKPTIAGKMSFDNLSYDEVRVHYFG